MINQGEATSAPTLARAARTGGPEFRVLIQVPELSRQRHAEIPRGVAPKSRFETGVVGRARASARRVPKRRLKREVRIAGYLLLLCLPLIYGVSRTWSGHLSEIAATELTRTTEPDDELETKGLGSTLARQVSRSVFEPAVILMSIEPAQEAPVNFPGYLLPENSHEDTAHEGS